LLFNNKSINKQFKIKKRAFNKDNINFELYITQNIINIDIEKIKNKL